MADKEKLSIYLVEGTGELPAGLIKSEDIEEELNIYVPNSDRATLFIRKNNTSSYPSWVYSLLNNIEGLDKQSFGISGGIGAVLLVQFHSYTFLISFGQGFHMINKQFVERDFGLRVALNALNPEKLKSIDKHDLTALPKNARIQSAKEIDIVAMELDRVADVVNAVSGATNEEAAYTLGERVSGRDALTITVPFNFDVLVTEVLNTCKELYEQDLPKRFEDLENIRRVRQQNKIDCYNQMLVDAINAKQFDGIWLGEPEIIDWEKHAGFRFSNERGKQVRALLTMGKYVEVCALKETPITVELLYSNKVHSVGGDGLTINSWSVFRFIYAEIKVDSQTLLLRNGYWYKAKDSFVDTINHELKKIAVSELENAHDWDTDEGTYNQQYVENYNKDAYETVAHVLDKKNINIGGSYSKIEHCDILKYDREFIHVKLYSGSATLSHLFAQGVVASELFVSDSTYRTKLCERVPCKDWLEPLAQPDARDYQITFAIAANKKLPDELPFFSKVTLKQAVNRLQMLGYQCELKRIPVCPDHHKKASCK